MKEEHTDIPKAQDRKTGAKGDLGVWPDDISLNPAPVWDGNPAVFTHVTHVPLLSHVGIGDELVVISDDRAVICSVEAVEREDDPNNEES